VPFDAIGDQAFRVDRFVDDGLREWAGEQLFGEDPGDAAGEGLGRDRDGVIDPCPEDDQIAGAGLGNVEDQARDGDVVALEEFGMGKELAE
jgi:hypothetical protein